MKTLRLEPSGWLRVRHADGSGTAYHDPGSSQTYVATFPRDGVGVVVVVGGTVSANVWLEVVLTPYR
jgi:hypothetical protein